MTQSTLIKKWSNLLLDRLLEHRAANPGFTFAVRQVNRHKRLEKGYWFQGDENYIFIGFTARGDESNKTRSVGLVFHNFHGGKADCKVEIVFKTEQNEEIVALYRDFIASSRGYETIDQPYYRNYKFNKDYPSGDIIRNLERFLAEDWKELSAEVNRRGLAELFFVPEQDFIEYLNRIETLRGNPLHGNMAAEPSSAYTSDSVSEKGQLEIPVSVGDQEYALQLYEVEKTDSGVRKWQGEVEEISPRTWVEFIEKGGVVTDLKFSELLAPLQQVLYERLNDALKNLRQTELVPHRRSNTTFSSASMRAENR